MDRRVALQEALSVVGQTKESIRELESLMPGPVTENFRKRLVLELEHQSGNAEFRHKAHTLVGIYRDQFGVKDLIDQLDAGADLD